jgi:hypothetical protein
LKFVKSLPFLLVIMTIGAILPSLVQAAPSEQLYRLGRHIYDEWGVFRTRGDGIDGFLGVTTTTIGGVAKATSFDPVITRESLGENADVAWQLGKEFSLKYPDRNQRAEQIFYFVRDRVSYTSDTDQFGKLEFAQNADEVVATILANGAAQGDCEDSAILLAVLYKGAGYRSAMVLMPGHVATLVYLPEYGKAPRKMTLGEEPGWVWAEATGATNPFGWVPEARVGWEMIAREVTLGPLETQEGDPGAMKIEAGAPAGRSGTVSGTGLLSFVGTIGLLWIMVGGRGGTGLPGRRR